MSQPVDTLRRNRLYLAWLVFGIGGLGLGYVANALNVTRTVQPVTQPYPFNHSAHAKAGCTTCHHGVQTQAHAGLPSLEACQDCHATAPGQPDADQVATWDRAADGDVSPWMRLYQVPEHVYFSHRRHVVLADLSCDTCHGDIGLSTQTLRTPVGPILMADCLQCHEDHGVTTDCTACHR